MSKCCANFDLPHFECLECSEYEACQDESVCLSCQKKMMAPEIRDMPPSLWPPAGFTHIYAEWQSKVRSAPVAGRIYGFPLTFEEQVTWRQRIWWRFLDCLPHLHLPVCWRDHS